MFIRLKNRRVKINGSIANIGGVRSLDFVVDGNSFPFSSTNPTLATFRIQSHIPNTMFINYGDGVEVEYSSFPKSSYHSIQINQNASTHVNDIYPPHVYQDGFSGERSIRIRFQHPSEVSYLYAHFVNIFGYFPRNIDALKSLRFISLRRNYLTSFPNTMNKLANLVSLYLDNIGSAIYERIPDSILQTDLQNLTITDSVNLNDVYASNFFNLCENLEDTLIYLDIVSTNILTLPPNFSNLVNLTTLRIGGRNIYTTLPPEVNQIPSLETLVTGVTSGNHRDIMTHFGSFSNLVNLSSMTHGRSLILEQFIPDDFENCVKIKSYNFGGSFQTLARKDRFINEMYAFITSNASMSTGNTAFRQMNIVAANTADPAPEGSGTYQQPSGYVQGSNNGSPASPLEKIWVLVNQYQHTWTY